MSFFMKKPICCFLFLLASFPAMSVESLDYCPDKLKEYSLVLNSKVQMLKAYIQNEADIHKTIQHQINYLNPYFVNNAQSVVLSPLEKIEIISRKKIKMPLPFSIDNRNFESPEDHYFTQVLKNKPRQLQEVEMLEVAFQAELKMVKCADVAVEQEYFLPLMPQLAYWYITPEMRSEYEYVTGAKDVVNPCASNELADFHKPYYFWYFWNPTRSTRGSLCRETYRDHKLNHLARITIKSEGDSQAQTAKMKSATPIHKVSVIYGNLNQKFNRHDLEQINRNYHAGNIYFDMLDLNARNLFTLIDHLTRSLQYKIGEWTLKENAIYFTLKNEHSSIDFFVGSTDIHSVLGAQHLDFYKNALMSSDLVVYSGHAGLGENFKIPPGLELNSIKAKELALISCYSYRYGEEDKLKNNTHVERIYYTGYDVTHSYKEILKVIDRSLNQKNSKLSETISLNEGFSFIKELRI